MQNFYKLFLLLIMSVGLVMVGCGGSVSPTLDATDGTAATVTISWANCGDGPFTVTKDADPEGSFATSVGTTPDETIDDTSPGTGPVFYKVSGCEFEGVDLVDGGFASGWTSPGALETCFDSIQEANGCIHDRGNICWPDPASLLNSTVTYPGGTSGDMDITFNLEVGGDGAWAVAVFDFDNLADTCTNDVVMNGKQIAPVTVSDYDGWMNGSTTFSGGAGCGGNDTLLLYNVQVVNKDTVSGNYYLKNAGNIEYFIHEPGSGAPGDNCSDWDTCGVATGCP